ncbi:MAG: hypothetical protein J0L53_00510 [Spirochaetes bacterium]|nr:hypothetical protein [Spirochaetota bacterium]MBX3723335.1 hypothetical protein [Turneriella sp.]
MKVRHLFIVGFVVLSSGIGAKAKFINKDTLEVTAPGKARKSGSAMRDESSCKEAARSEALRIAIETLVDMNWPNVRGKVSREKYGEKVTQTTEGSIRGAHVVRASVDTSVDPVVCTVTVRIQRMDPASTHKRVMQALDAEAAGNKEILATPTPKK